MDSSAMTNSSRYDSGAKGCSKDSQQHLRFECNLDFIM